jgi:NAD(P)-dependent dehydrogenase (short-subunit alcohol dehydrogenase family)
MNIPPSLAGPTLTGQYAIVTGGARGIGLGICRQLEAGGARVAVWDRDLAPLAASGYTPAFARQVDVTSAADVEAAFAETAALGQVHVLVNNAGINGPVAPAADYPLAAWEQVLAVDLTGVFHCCRPAVRHMGTHGYGRIVTIASIAGKEGMPGISAYSAAKAGVIGFSKALAREVVGQGITVNCVTPAITETELFKEMTQAHIEGAKARIPMGRFCSIEDIAAMVAWLASRECSFTTGAVFDVTGGRATY